MKRLLQPFIAAVTAILLLVYVYVAWRLGSGLWHWFALALPFVLVWMVPAVYWGGRQRDDSVFHRAVLQASYLSMGGLSFLVVLTIARDLVILVTRVVPVPAAAHAFARDAGAEMVIAGSLLALLIGVIRALRGPRVRAVDIPIAGLHKDLEGFRIAQVSDVHVGRTIRGPYVERVVALTRTLNADLVALTGDMVDGLSLIHI